MGRKIVYWVTTGIVAALCVFDGFAYLSGRAVPIFAHVGYPQQLRVILGIAKPLGAIALLVPGCFEFGSGNNVRGFPILRTSDDAT